MERSPHPSLRTEAENSKLRDSYGLNTCVDRFAVAMKRSTSPDTGREDERQLIDTAPTDRTFLDLKEDARGKFDIPRWAPETSGWVREEGEPIKNTPRIGIQ